MPQNGGVLWRREGDSNPRYHRWYNGFQDRRNRPLCHLSVADPSQSGNDPMVAGSLKQPTGDLVPWRADRSGPTIET